VNGPGCERAEVAGLSRIPSCAQNSWLSAHGMSMRSKREMIGKLGETGTKGPREQGINDLRRRGRGCLGAARLDTVLGWGQESGKTKGTSRLSLGSWVPYS
jgi:hypothetical protein